MAEETFSDIGKMEALRRLFEGTGFTMKDNCSLKISKEAGSVVNSSVMMTEGIDFDLTYFPLKHLGFKAVTAATGEIYAAMAHPGALAVRLGISSKIDFGRIKDTVGLNLSFMVQNVFTITKYSGVDPEIYLGVDQNFYPRPRIYSLGIGLTF